MSKLGFLSLTVVVSFVGFSSGLHARITHHSANSSTAVPTLDADAGCHDGANRDLNRTTNYSNCIADERTARAELLKE
jgi:hypothetical protein